MLVDSPLMLAQAEAQYPVPSYFYVVFLALLALGIVGWLIAAVLGFARARAFGPSTRWFAFSAVCLIIYHLQFLLLAFAVYSDADTALNVGAFFNLFVLLGGICAIMGFVRLTNPE
jgi:hypothetical protein